MPPPFKACGLAHEDACTRRLDLIATMHTIAAFECVCKAWPGIMESFWLELHKRITGLAPMSTGKKDLRLSGCSIFMGHSGMSENEYSRDDWQDPELSGWFPSGLMSGYNDKSDCKSWLAHLFETTAVKYGSVARHLQGR